MSAIESGLQAWAWARLARATAHANEHASAEPAANRELFDAIEFAATEGRLNLRELVDVYLVGAPQLDVSDAWETVEDYLDRIADVHALRLDDAFGRADRALSDWRRQLRLRIAAHDLALSAHRALGAHGERIEQTRLAVADVLEGAKAADATQQELDAFEGHNVAQRVRHALECGERTVAVRRGSAGRKLSVRLRDGTECTAWPAREVFSHRIVCFPRVERYAGRAYRVESIWPSGSRSATGAVERPAVTARRLPSTWRALLRPRWCVRRERSSWSKPGTHHAGCS